jgi:hypothetical protein
MAIKIVQNVNKIFPTVSVAATSNPISLKSGYIRVSTGLTSVYVEIGGNPVVTTDSFHIPPYHTEVLKERIARQRIIGITTGTSTVIAIENSAGNPFLINDYVTIENAQPSGINTEHSLVTAITDSTLTISTNTSAIVGVVTISNAILSRSVKVASLSDAPTSLSISEVVQLVTE